MPEAVLLTSGEPGPPGGVVTLESSYTRGLLNDALSLSHYVLSTGIRSANGQPLPLDDVVVIQATAAKLGILEAGDGAEPPRGQSISADDWAAFERAYYRLAALTSPVTAETLAATRATRWGPDEPYNWRDQIFGYSPALRFTRRFAFAAIVIAILIVTGECLVYYWGLEPDTTIYAGRRNVTQTLLPWAYGALGSCAYLLRSAHYFIYQRCFDLRRKPEYFNRVLLGAISGGAIILFVDYLVDKDSGDVLHLSSAALGFVAGYSTDFLFNMIERVIAAIFPKTDEDPNARKQVANKLPTQRKKIGSDAPTDEPKEGGEEDRVNADKPRARRKRASTETKDSP